MEWKILAASTIAAILVVYMMLPHSTNTPLKNINTKEYTMYMTYGSDTVTMIKYAPDRYYYVSNGTPFGISGKYVITIYKQTGNTTVEERIYVNKPFNECNIGDPLLEGEIVYITDTTTRIEVDARHFYYNGCYLFPNTPDLLSLTISINQNTIVMSAPGQSFYLKIIGKK